MTLHRTLLGGLVLVGGLGLAGLAHGQTPPPHPIRPPPAPRLVHPQPVAPPPAPVEHVPPPPPTGAKHAKGKHHGRGPEGEGPPGQRDKD